MIKLLISSFVIFLFLSCHDRVTLVEKDLLPYGMALTISIPDSSEIKAMNWGMQKDISIEGEDNFSLQIFDEQPLNRDLQALKESVKEEIEKSPMFYEITREDEDGFIFELNIDSTQSFDFRHFKIRGEHLYTFRAGLFGTFSLEEIKRLYEISKEAK